MADGLPFAFNPASGIFQSQDIYNRLAQQRLANQLSAEKLTQARMETPFLPQQLQTEESMKKAQLQQALLGVQYYPQKTQAQIDLERAQTQYYKEKPALAGLGDPVAKARFRLQQIGATYGADSQQYKDASGDLDRAIRGQESNIAWHQKLAEYMSKRVSSPLGKVMTEQAQLETGKPLLGVPSEDISERPSAIPEQQIQTAQTTLGTTDPGQKVDQQKINAAAEATKSYPVETKNKQVYPFGTETSAAYTLYTSSLIGNKDNIKKLSYAGQAEQTIVNLKNDLPAMKYYSGVAGGAKYRQDQLTAQTTGQIPPMLSSYERFLTNVGILKAQVTQYYGLSVQPEQTKEIGELANPSSWTTAPDVAEKKFNEFVKTLGQEIAIRRNIVTHPHVLFNPDSDTKAIIDRDKAEAAMAVKPTSPSSQLTSEPLLGKKIRVISPNGKKGTIPEEDLKEALAAGYKKVE